MRKKHKSKVCFIIAPIGKKDSPIHERSEIIFHYVIKKALEPLGYEAQRADIPEEPGSITDQIIKHILKDELAIADLTGGNPNVFYELSLRHMVKKPCIHIIEEGSEIPFDVGQLNVIRVNHNHLPTVEQVKKQIAEQIKQIEDDAFEMMTPISTAIDLKALSESGDAATRSIADIMAAVSNIRNTLSKIESDIYEIKHKDSRYEPLTGAIHHSDISKTLFAPGVLSDTVLRYPEENVVYLDDKKTPDASE